MRIHVTYASGVCTTFHSSALDFLLVFLNKLTELYDLAALYTEMYWTTFFIQLYASRFLTNSQISWEASFLVSLLGLKEYAFCPPGAPCAHVLFCSKFKLLHLTQTFNSRVTLSFLSCPFIFCQNRLIEQIVFRKYSIRSCRYLVIRNRKGCFHYLTYTVCTQLVSAAKPILYESWQWPSKEKSGWTHFCSQSGLSRSRLNGAKTELASVSWQTNKKPSQQQQQKTQNRSFSVKYFKIRISLNWQQEIINILNTVLKCKAKRTFFFLSSIPLTPAV